MARNLLQNEKLSSLIDAATGGAIALLLLENIISARFTPVIAIYPKIKPLKYFYFCMTGSLHLATHSWNILSHESAIIGYEEMHIQMFHNNPVTWIHSHLGNI